MFSNKKKPTKPKAPSRQGRNLSQVSYYVVSLDYEHHNSPYNFQLVFNGYFLLIEYFVMYTCRLQYLPNKDQ